VLLLLPLPLPVRESKAAGRAGGAEVGHASDSVALCAPSKCAKAIGDAALDDPLLLLVPLRLLLSGAEGSCTSNWIMKENVEPTPSSLVHHTRPPMASARRCTGEKTTTQHR